MARVVFRLEARADFDAIFDYIALDNPLRALSFVDELEKASAGLAEHPNKAPLALEAGTDVRRLTYGSYNIYYRYSGGVVHILRVLEGHRDVT